MPTTQALITKIQDLPPEELDEVENFIDFLSTKRRRRAALDHLLSVAPALEAAGVPAMTEAELQAEIDAARAARRVQGTGADRS